MAQIFVRGFTFIQFVLFPQCCVHFTFSMLPVLLYRRPLLRRMVQMERKIRRHLPRAALVALPGKNNLLHPHPRDRATIVRLVETRRPCPLLILRRVRVLRLRNLLNVLHFRKISVSHVILRRARLSRRMTMQTRFVLLFEHTPGHDSLGGVWRFFGKFSDTEIFFGSRQFFEK